MPGETKHGIECTEFEALLSDGLEGRLSAARKESFEAHRRVCAVCGPLFADEQACAGGDARRQDDSVRRAVEGAVGFLLSFFLHSGVGVCASAAVCDVVWDDLLLVLAGGNAGWREAVGRGEGQPAAIDVASCL